VSRTVQIPKVRFDYILTNFFHLAYNILPKVNVMLCELVIKVTLKFTIRQFIAWLILAIFLGSFLNSIVGQMNIHIVQVFQSKQFTTRSYVSVRIPISLEKAIDDSYHHIVANIKLPTIIQKRVRDIWLHYCRLYLPIMVCLAL